MKFISIIALVVLTSNVFCQRKISYSYSEISKIQFENCSQIKYLILNEHIQKHRGRLTISIHGGASKIFVDDKSDENFKEYQYLGDLKGKRIALVKLIEYNNEAFLLINQATGTIDTLISLPVFSDNMKDFACINNPGTDEKQQIQICEIRNGIVYNRIYINGKQDTFFENIACIKRNSILLKDNKNKYWQLYFKF